MTSISAPRRAFWSAWACAAVFLSALLASSALPRHAAAEGEKKAGAFRPPSVPLVVSDPYLSIWSGADRLTDGPTRHWTGRPHPLASLIRIDGKPFRLMGSLPEDVPAFPQANVRVLPTRSLYDFDDGHVHVSLTFLTPALPHDLDVLARPVTYLTWNVKSVDDKPHRVALFDSVSALLSVHQPNHRVVWKRGTIAKAGLTTLRVGTEEQTYLSPAGDDTRINWGWAYAAALSRDAQSVIAGEADCFGAFVRTGTLPTSDDKRMPRAANDNTPTLAFSFDLGSVGAKPVSRRVLVAYDQVYSIDYFGAHLRPYWRRNGATADDLLATAERDYAALNARCEAFDADLMRDLTRAGGPNYATIGALAYRQCLAGNGIAADANKQPLVFPKENSSNGDIATVDILFPMDPMLILFSPTLAKASLAPVMTYAASNRWKFPNAPHDLGTYPVAHGRDDGGEAMPVEESGNMLILFDAIAQEENSPAFASRWWPQLTEWAKYLEQYGLDPENQLCTDDFMGHLAHNANLSVKAILGLAAYGDLCRMRGDTKNAARYRMMAKEFAQHWMKVANDGNHYRLAFDKPNTWSQKYNLVWDRILHLNIFPPEVARTEVAFYKSVLQPYGVPLDSRTHLTKTDWSLWTATLAENETDFRALVDPIVTYLNGATGRLPFVDSYQTDSLEARGVVFRARPVIGGVFIKMLAEPALWKKWSTGDTKIAGNWAALPLPPKITTILPTGKDTAVPWLYTTEKPDAGWTAPGFAGTGWTEGNAGFGSEGTPGIAVKTPWKTSDIWMRRTITLPSGNLSGLEFLAYHDEDVEIYVNGILAAQASGFVTEYTPMAIRPAALALLKPGATVTLAVHCHQTNGGQGVDVGLARVERQKQPGD